MRTTLRHAFLLFAPAVIALFAPTAPGQALPEPIAPPDTWGYEMYDQTTGSCPFQFVDLASGGSLLTFPAPGDDEGAVLVPTRPFQLYGSPVFGFVASTNGYLAATGSLSAEDGRDYSNDSVPSVPGYVPLVPGTPTASFPGRIAVFHDDLALGGGSVRWQEAASCPRASGAVAGEACTVVQWSGVSRAGGSEPLTFQAILYHSSFAIALQVAASDGSGGGSASAGIQDLEARLGLSYAANEPGRLGPGTAVCFFDPRHPAGGPRADLRLSTTAKVEPSAPDALVTYGVAVFNAGPSDATGGTVDAPFPSGLEWESDSCGGAFAAGQWVLDALPAGGSAECHVTARVVATVEGIVTHPFVVNGDATDPDPTNDGVDVLVQVFVPAPVDDGDGVPASTEDSFPGGLGVPPLAPGDGNGDGIADSLQAGVASLPAASGAGWLTVELLGGGCSSLQEVAALAESAVAEGDLQYDFPHGLVAFRIPCPAGGASVRVWYHGASAVPPVYRKYGPLVPGDGVAVWYTLPGVGFGESRGIPTASFTLVDGQTGDDTGIDGVIVDQGGPGQPGESVATIPVAGPWGLATLAALILAAGIALQRSRLR
ncbi:MAG TPA: DUF11 domain-containing protein [Thermoanaerobaculia bacterium]|nr:DUF11 domain-containing protein [Thermoanaerobaculia bacterium]HQN07043.1 DUF11 domain-containing protein [Thermoanaerobaculia bacterium]HQP87014.1 DUF11 domain-containing protein [Thermoanaerobaculia bacterium]